VPLQLGGIAIDVPGLNIGVYREAAEHCECPFWVSLVQSRSSGEGGRDWSPCIMRVYVYLEAGLTCRLVLAALSLHQSNSNGSADGNDGKSYDSNTLWQTLRRAMVALVSAGICYWRS
jgi:hypothetical protein